MRKLAAVLALVSLATLLLAQETVVINIHRRPVAASGTPCVGTDFSNGWNLCQQKGVANAGSGATATATLDTNTVAGHQLVVFASFCADDSCNAATTAITCTVAHGADSVEGAAGNPYRLNYFSSNVGGYAWVFPSMASTSNSVVVNCTGATAYYVTNFVSEWSGGIASGIIDQAAGAADFAASAAVTTAATTNANDLVIGYIVLSAANAVAATAPFTEIGEVGSGTEHAAKSVTSTGAQSCNWTFTSTTWDGLCMALKH